MAKPNTPVVIQPDEQYRQEYDALSREAERTHPEAVLRSPAGTDTGVRCIPDAYRERFLDIQRRWEERTGAVQKRQPLQVQPGDYVTINGHRFEVTRVNHETGVIDTRRRDTRGGETTVPCDGEGLVPDPPELGPPAPVPAADIEDWRARIRMMIRRHAASLGDRA